MVSRSLASVLSLTVFLAALSSPAYAQSDTDKTRIASEALLPASTKAWFSVPDYSKLKEKFGSTEFGKLTKDEKLKPFIASFQAQLRGVLNKQNVRLGVKVEDLQEVRTGEICFAGVLEQTADGQGDDSQLGRGSHGMVLLVDVSSTEDRARALMKKVDGDFEKRGAERVKMASINGVEVTRWNIHRPKMLVKTKSTYHAVAGGWLLVSDNENIFREVIRRLASVKKINESETLGAQPSFMAVKKNVSLDGVEADLRWFVDPFGYIELAQAIRREDQSRKVRENDIARILKEEGFNALQAAGGQVSFATDKHEMLHRTFVFAPKSGGMNQKRFFGLFDFKNRYGHSLEPQSWVPTEISSYLTTSWDMSKTFNNVGGVVDSIIEEGAFDNVIESFKEEFNVNLPELVGSFDNQVNVISASALPINEDSERMAICLPLNKNIEGTLDIVKRALGPQVQVKEILGETVLLVETTEEDLGDDDEWQDFEDPDEMDDEEEDIDGEEVADFQLFEKKYFVVKHDYLIIANNQAFMKQIIQGNVKSPVSEASDYKLVKNSLDSIVDDEKVSFRHFGRVDRSLKVNYEMLRQGKMGNSNTILARIINRVLESSEAAEEANPEEPRDQKLDGSKLPDDYDKHVAKYFGPMGWALETEDEGWRITGCMLKKKVVNKVVRQTSSKSTR